MTSIVYLLGVMGNGGSYSSKLPGILGGVLGTVGAFSGVAGCEGGDCLVCGSDSSVVTVDGSSVGVFSEAMRGGVYSTSPDLGNVTCRDTTTFRFEGM